MTNEEVRGLIQESRVTGFGIQQVRSSFPGSAAYVVRVPSMAQAEQIMSDWDNKIVQGSRLSIRIMDEVYDEGAAGDMHGYGYLPQGDQYARFQWAGGENNIEGEGFQSHQVDDTYVELPLRMLVPNDFIGAIIGRGGNQTSYLLRSISMYMI